MPDFTEIWSYLAARPLVWLWATLAAFALADGIARALGRHPLANPVLLAVLALAGALALTGTPYETYFEGAQFVHFLLGPATVCLAVPLARGLGEVGRVILPAAAALLAGSLVAAGSALLLGRALGLDRATLLALAPKSATAPVAMGIADGVGGSPTLAAVLVILTGITGAILATPLLDALGVRDWRARGFAVGVAAHGIGTARAYVVNETAGRFAGLGMGLNALLTALLVPLLLRLLP